MGCRSVIPSSEGFSKKRGSAKPEMEALRAEEYAEMELLIS